MAAARRKGTPFPLQGEHPFPTVVTPRRTKQDHHPLQRDHPPPRNEVTKKIQQKRSDPQGTAAPFRKKEATKGRTMTRVQIWKQESPSKMTRLVFLPKPVKDGPRDDDIEIVGVEPVLADECGDFLLDPNFNIDAFDAVHAFTTVRMIMDMYQRCLWRIGREKPLKWQWGQDRIQVNPRGGIAPGACYSRMNRSIDFYTMKFTTTHGPTLNHSMRSFDVVSHEVAHAILDALRPGYWSSWQAETGALHESFADLTAIFATLSQLDLCRSIIFLSRGDLHDKSYFWITNGGQPVDEENPGKGFASADNELTMYEVAAEVHEISLVFTGAIYDILADIFAHQSSPDTKDDTETLYKVGHHVCDLLLQAMLKGPPQNATFKDIADRMIASEKSHVIKQIIRSHFERRCILGKDRIVPPTKPVDDIRWGNCQCCMSSDEHLISVEDGTSHAMSCLPTGATRIIQGRRR